MRKSLLSVAAIGVTALLLSSCAMPADDPNFNNGANGPVLGSEAASAAAADQATMTAALAAPPSIGVDAPLPAAPAKGATIISLTDGSEYQAVFETALADAAKVLGWKVESVKVDPADPAAAGTAFDAALAKKPAGIHINGAFAEALATNLAAAETAKVPVVCTGCSGDPAGGITDTSIDGTAQNTEWADAMASYVITNRAPGEDAAVQVIPSPGGAVADFNLEFETSLNSQCHNCSATESVVDPTTLDLTDPAAVSAFVVSEMSTSLGAWALLDTGAMSGGVADALASDPTLLTPVVLIGRGAAASDVAALKALGGAAPVASAGTSASAAPASSVAASPSADSAAASSAASAAPADSAASGEGAASRTPEQAAALQAWIAIPQPVMAWRVIDQFARIAGGAELATGPLPSQLLTGSNAGDAVVDDAGNFIGIADYQAQFTKLWGVK